MDMNASQKSAEIINIDSKKTAVIPLCAHVKQTVEQYFLHLNGHDAVGLHAMVIAEVEKPLLQATLEHSGHNQTKAAKALGLSRSTLRKKLEFYGLS
jgi:Fis family transcriptional regulator